MRHFVVLGLEAKSVLGISLWVINSCMHLAISGALKVFVIFFDLPLYLWLPGKDNPLLRSLIFVPARCLWTDVCTHIILLHTTSKVGLLCIFPRVLLYSICKQFSFLKAKVESNAWNWCVWDPDPCLKWNVCAVEFSVAMFCCQCMFFFWI